MDWDILLTVYVLLLLLQCCLCVDLTYHVEEEQDPGTYIGDIAADAQLLDNVLSQDHSQITFGQLQRRGSHSYQLFNVTKTGKLYTAQTLDAESLCTYNKECFKTVKVAVHKSNAFMKILKIKVIIEDINDHQPEFHVKQVNIQFLEGYSKGATKSIPNAIDDDVSVLNSKINYQLEKKQNEPFSLFVSEGVIGMSSLKIVSDQKLDREIKNTYMLQIIAKDGGYPQKQSILNVQVSVTDENDNQPIFSQKIYNVSIKNTHTKHIPFVTLSATDLDLGNNGRISYNFNRKMSTFNRKIFKLISKTGEIFLNEKSSLNIKQTYELVVEAKDGGSPPLSSIVIVLVNVVNDFNNVPTIDIDSVSALTGNITAILEDSKVGSFIAYVMVTDNDIGQNGEVSCDIQHDKFQLLSIGSKEYKVILKKAVDRETKNHYDIIITCQDKGSPPLETEIKFPIQVMDINDVQPQFSKDTFKFLTYENRKPNFPLGFINATDPDLGPGGQLSYSLISDNKEDNLPFQVTDYGFISTKQSIDRELKDNYDFKILVKDNGTPSLNNTANINVEILDENDNAPYFTFPSVNPFSLDMRYYLNSKNDISVLKASDKDSQGNAFLRYGILGGNYKRLFKVNSYTGMLSFSRKVYQNDAGTYDLVLVVKDNGTPVLSATTTLSLTLTVSNKTMLTAVDIQSEGMLDVTLLIIIVTAAVIVSMAIVVSITLCVFRCINGSGSSATPVQNPPYQARTEMRQLIYQTNNPVIINPEEILNRNTQSIRSKSQFYPGEAEGSQNEWKFSTTPRRPPPGTQCYNQDVPGTLCQKQVEQNYLNETLSTQRDSGHGCSERDTEHYEELPGLCNMSPNSERQQYQDTYLKPL